MQKIKRINPSDSELYPIIFDPVFRYLFGRKENSYAVGKFLSVVLGMPLSEFSDLKFVNEFSLKDKIGKKWSIYDIKITTSSGKMTIDIEIQVGNTYEMIERSICYVSQILSDELKLGRNYKQKKVKLVLITDFKLTKEEKKYCSRISMHDEETHEKVSDILQIIILELPKVPKNLDDELCLWLNFIKSEREEEMQKCAQKEPIMEKLIEDTKYISRSDIESHEEIRRYWARVEEQEREERKRLNEEMLKNREAKGKIEGERMAKLNTARILLDKNMEIDFILEVTGLSFEEIKNLR